MAGAGTPGVLLAGRGASDDVFVGAGDLDAGGLSLAPRLGACAGVLVVLVVLVSVVLTGVARFEAGAFFAFGDVFTPR